MSHGCQYVVCLLCSRPQNWKLAHLQSPIHHLFSLFFCLDTYHCDHFSFSPLSSISAKSSSEEESFDGLFSPKSVGCEHIGVMASGYLATDARQAGFARDMPPPSTHSNGQLIPPAAAQRYLSTRPDHIFAASSTSAAGSPSVYRNVAEGHQRLRLPPQDSLPVLVGYRRDPNWELPTPSSASATSNNTSTIQSGEGSANSTYQERRKENRKRTGMAEPRARAARHKGHMNFAQECTFCFTSTMSGRVCAPVEISQ
jgi:hypothetical protein